MGINMGESQNEKRKNLSYESIYKIMQWFPMGVSGIFFLINLLKRNGAAMAAIGLCLAVYIGVSVLAKVRELPLYNREVISAISLPVLVFVISMFSGASYSDDFSLYLATIALAGLYLEPKITRMQVVFVDILLVMMYLIHPEKAGERSQYILCAVCFTLAAYLFYLVIKRGRVFIEIGEERAIESQRLLDSIRNMGIKLERDFEESAVRIEAGTRELRRGSDTIAHDAGEVSHSCDVVQDKIKETESQIVLMNEEVRQFENALRENKDNVEAMNVQIDSAGEIISESGAAFRTMEEQMHEIAGIAKQINDISFRLTILSLNASVEAAHAGGNGSGFEVLANEMRELSETSAGFSAQVSEVVKALMERVERTSDRLAGSETALSRSEKAMTELVGSFERLNRQFELLYENIECQNKNVNQINYIFDDLNEKVSDMHSSSLANQNAVESIIDAMKAFSGNVSKIVKNTQSI